jgi:hypothetical protein
MTQPIQEPTEPGYYFATRGVYRQPVQVFFDKYAKRLRVVALGYSDYDELEEYVNYAPAIDLLAEPQR